MPETGSHDARAAPAAVALEIDFTAAGNSHAFTGAGWARPEAGHSWALRPEAQLTIAAPKRRTSQILALQIAPFKTGGAVTHQRVEILLNGQPACAQDITEEIVIALAVPMTAAADRIDVRLRFLTAAPPASPDAPGDRRPLALMVRKAWLFDCDDVLTGGSRPLPPVTAAALPPAEIFAGFESVGLNCDFGLVQRAAGIEPLGLLRFAGATPRNIFLGLMDGFSRLGAREDIEPFVPADIGEYLIFERAYGMRYHSFVPADRASPDQLIAREMSRLPFLRRKFLEDLALGEKIFLLRATISVSDAEARAFWAAINCHGRNTLLFIDRDNRGETGTVEMLAPRFLLGHAGPAPDQAVWLRLCTAARQGNARQIR